MPFGAGRRPLSSVATPGPEREARKARESPPIEPRKAKTLFVFSSVTRRLPFASSLLDSPIASSPPSALHSLSTRRVFFSIGKNRVRLITRAGAIAWLETGAEREVKEDESKRRKRAVEKRCSARQQSSDYSHPKKEQDETTLPRARRDGAALSLSPPCLSLRCLIACVSPAHVEIPTHRLPPRNELKKNRTETRESFVSPFDDCSISSRNPPYRSPTFRSHSKTTNGSRSCDDEELVRSGRRRRSGARGRR